MEKEPTVVLTQDPIIVVLLSTRDQESEEDATFNNGQNLPNFSTDMTKFLKTNANRLIVGNSMIYRAHINA